MAPAQGFPFRVELRKQQGSGSQGPPPASASSQQMANMPSQNRPIVRRHPKWRTVPCRHHKRGHCNWGENCNFLHAEVNSSYQPPREISPSARVEHRKPAQGNQRHENQYHDRGNDYREPYLTAPIFRTQLHPTAKHKTNPHRDGSNITNPVRDREATAVPCRHDVVGGTNHRPYTANADSKRIGTSMESLTEPPTIRPGSPSKNVH